MCAKKDLRTSKIMNILDFLGVFFGSFSVQPRDLSEALAHVAETVHHCQRAASATAERLPDLPV